MNANDLIQKGFVQQPDGSWAKPKRDVVGCLEANRPKRAKVETLDGGQAIHRRRQGRVERRVTLIACRRRLLDNDAIAYSMKGLTDAIAATLGVDDADPRVEWNWQQIKTSGQEGVIVRIEEV